MKGRYGEGRGAQVEKCMNMSTRREKKGKGKKKLHSKQLKLNHSLIQNKQANIIARKEPSLNRTFCTSEHIQ